MVFFIVLILCVFVKQSALGSNTGCELGWCTPPEMLAWPTWDVSWADVSHLRCELGWCTPPEMLACLAVLHLSCEFGCGTVPVPQAWLACSWAVGLALLLYLSCDLGCGIVPELWAWLWYCTWAVSLAVFLYLSAWLWFCIWAVSLAVVLCLSFALGCGTVPELWAWLWCLSCPPCPWPARLCPAHRRPSYPCPCQLIKTFLYQVNVVFIGAHNMVILFLIGWISFLKLACH